MSRFHSRSEPGHQMPANAARTRPPAYGMRALRFMLPLAGIMGLPLPSLAATLYSPSFAGPGLDYGLAEGGSDGTSLAVGGGNLVLSLDAGKGNGGISVTTTFSLAGNFVASVRASGVGLGRGGLGMSLGSADVGNTLADLFLNGASVTVNGNIFQPVFSGAYLQNPATSPTLTISRVGDTVSEIFDPGSGPVLVNSGTGAALGVPMTIDLFLEVASGDLGAHQGTFSDFTVDSVPEPATAALLASGICALLVSRSARPAGNRSRGGPPGV